MFLSRVILDLHKPETAKALVRPSRMHGAVERSFPGGRPHALWRIDRQGNGASLLIVSADQPELADLRRQFGTETEPSATADYSAFLQGVREGGRYHFRLTVNPTVKVNGKRVPLVLGGASRHGNASDWTRGRMQKAGFDVTWLELREHRNIAFRREDGLRVQFLQVTFEGGCTVTDAAAAREALQKGIGHEKAYGCGLLTLFPEA